MLRLTVVGALGRLGSAILRRAFADPAAFSVAGAVMRAGSASIGRDAGEAVGAGKSGILVSDKLPEDPGIVVDVSTPESLPGLLRWAELGGALVVATTGHDAEARNALERAGKKARILLAPNLSVGVALLRRLVAEASRLLPEADVEIVESHHNKKADAPSGTAKLLFDAVASGKPGAEMVTGREGRPGARKSKEVGVFALRLGDVVGEHTVTFGWDSQRIELSHRAHSREVFAAGALEAARFLSGRAPGFYTVDDLVNARLGGLR